MIRRSAAAGPLAVATLLVLLAVPETRGADPLVPQSTSAADTAIPAIPKTPPADSLAGPGADSAAVRTTAARADSTRARALPERTLGLREQVMFAGGFMAFIALMMASMQNFNP